MNASPTTPYHKGQNEDKKINREKPRLVDIQTSIRIYSSYVQRAVAIVQKLKGRIKYYENQKLLNDYQEKRWAEAEELVIVLLGFQGAAKDMIYHFENREADAWNTIASNAEQEIEFTQIMQQKFKEKCQEMEELRKENEELRKDNQELHKYIIEFAP